MAPDRAIWACDNRGVMVRVMGQPGDPTTHLENRIGEPAANPYLYIASQIYSGLDGIARKLDAGPSADRPYEMNAPAFSKSLREAAAALRADEAMRAGLGGAFVDYYAHIKEAEFARFVKDADADTADVTSWEHNEYLDLF
jgi:glutamine synthetase